ncbi:conserved hypothetical protein [Candidatus Sulfotelmatobacter kueseliae]|uniref:Uncharacterized protein n=1 Tax=Candidatus Sulfotelmatobacter kueseliae TaxID=2042962 RepID=A0A2U3KE18_9BACT|nr:conserved hypothetical protein [Candidatus Sulfotelmatobacter kueseliae]
MLCGEARHVTRAKTVLIDLSVLRRGVFTHEAQIERRIRWANRDLVSRIAAWQPKPLPHDPWLRQQVECLPTIVRMTHEGALVPYTYSELEFEEMRASRGMANTFGDLFLDVEIKKCQAAVNRPRFRQNIDFDYYLKKEELLEFCDFLLNLPEPLLPRAREFWAKLPASEQTNLTQLGRFKSLCRHLARTHYPDAFHLWTAEANGLDFFLMIDKKFVNALRNCHELDFRCRAVSPEQLLNALGVTERDQYPYTESGPRTYY